MPRSYSFDHFTSRPQSPRASKVKKPASVPSEALHYGQRFAQTQKTLHGRAEHGPEKNAARPSVSAELPEVSISDDTLTIGALPLAPEEPPAQSLRAVIDESFATYRLLRAGLHDAWRAADRLLHIPSEAARLLAQRARAAWS